MAEPARFVIVSGLPASGKSSLGRALAEALALPVIDKDEILERLAGQEGSGDAEWRRALSRKGDTVLQAETLASPGGAVIVSFWRVEGMASDSGTPTDWLAQLPGALVNVHCLCPPRVAAYRFNRRVRTAGNEDQRQTYEGILAGLEALAELGPPRVGEPVEVDTSYSPRITVIVSRVEEAFARVVARQEPT
jgi:glucokinase